MAAGQKKVVVRRFSGDPAWGYLPSAGFVAEGQLSLLDPGGRVSAFALNDIKWIAYVRDFNLDDAVDPERLGRKSFLGRPRAGGLWVRLSFRDDDVLEGVAEFDLQTLEAVSEDRGLTLSPPDGRSNTARLFVPRSALTGMEVLGWIGSSPRPPARPKKKDAAEGQPGLFAE